MRKRTWLLALVCGVLPGFAWPAAAPAGPEASAPTGEGGGFDAVVLADGGLWLRTERGVDAPGLALLPKGSTVRVLDDGMAALFSGTGTYLDWVKVRAQGKTGWVAVRFLRPAGGTRWYDNARTYKSGYPVLLLLRADGRATVHVNMCEGFAALRGTWKRVDGKIVLTFGSNPGNGTLGEAGSSIEFLEQDGGLLKYTGKSVGCSPNEGDLFETW